MFFDISPEVPNFLRGDALRLGQVLNNLVGNAVKFTEVGEIHVQVTVVDLHDVEVEQQASLEFCVRDTGIGISPEQMERLFTAFTQADGSITRRFGGTGLGLVISQRLVQQMGGELTADSALGKGSSFRFVVTLPVIEGGHIDRAADALRGMRVLVVDDMETSRDVLAGILRSWDFQVAFAASGQEALDKLTKALDLGKAFELVLLDWKMPEVDGVEVTRRIHTLVHQQKLPQMPVVMMVTAFSRDQLLDELGHIRLDAVLTKPVTASRLFDAIMDVQRGTKQEEIESDSPSLFEQAQAIHGAHALVVEDNEINQTVARDLLRRMGVNSTMAANGEQALACLEQSEFDIVLMDLQMPVMDGLEATRRIRAHSCWANLPIVAMSAAVLPKDTQASHEAGMNGHIAKPIDSQILLSTLLKWIKPREQNSIETVQPYIPTKTGTFPDIPGIDRTQVTARLEGNVRLFNTLLMQVLEQFSNVDEELNSLLNAGKKEEAVKLLHNLRGVLGNIAANEVASLAMQTESAILDGADNQVRELLLRLMRARTEFFEYCRKYLTALQSQIAPESEATVKTVDPEKFDQLLVALYAKNMQAMGLFENLKPAIAARLGEELAVRLDNAMNNLRFAEAAEIIKTINQMP